MRCGSRRIPPAPGAAAPPPAPPAGRSYSTANRSSRSIAQDDRVARNAIVPQQQAGRVLLPSEPPPARLCFGDIPHPREGRPRRRRGVRFCGGSPAAAESLTTPPATALRPEGPCSARVRCCRDCPQAATGRPGPAGAESCPPGGVAVACLHRLIADVSSEPGCSWHSRPHHPGGEPAGQPSRATGGNSHSASSQRVGAGIAIAITRG